MDQSIKPSYGRVVKSGEYSCEKKPRILRAYGREYEIPVKTADFSGKLQAANKAIAGTSKLSNTVREVKNGIALFIGREEAERIFPDEKIDQIDIDEITSFWLALNSELEQGKNDMLARYTVSEVIRSNLLSGNLPSAYEYNGRVYEMQTDFREWIKFDLLITDEDILMKDKIRRLIEMIFPVVPDDISLWDFIMWFYHCGKIRSGSEGNGGEGIRQSQVYSFRHDAGYIHAAFLEIYGIDLTDIPYLHWWKFKALFDSLHDCKFTDIMGYRAEKITSKTPDYMKKFLTKMKKIYALPRSLSEQQKINELKKMKEEMGY